MPIRHAVLGASGKMGTALVRSFSLPGEIHPLKRPEMDLADPKKIRKVLTDLKPSFVLNAAAYNQVDDAENHPDMAFAINSKVVGVLAEVCRELGAVFVHFSTDYVFDGKKKNPYLETDEPNPISVYAKSKLEGERLALKNCEKTFIFRVCGLYGEAQSAQNTEKGFVERLLAWAKEGRKIRVVQDQVLAPSYAYDLAPKAWEVISTQKYGLYHLTNSGETSWYDFAREVFRLAKVQADLSPTTLEEFGAKAKRPPYSVLAHGSLKAVGEDDLRPWNEALAEYINRRYTR